MRIIKFNRGHMTYFKPEEKDDPRFLHCSDGAIEVTEAHYKNHVLPLIVMHGWLPDEHEEDKPERQ